MGIENYSKTPGSNNAAPPNGAPEGMPPSAVNDIIRQIMADVRTFFEAPQWTNYGSPGLAFYDGSNFKVTGDQTATYTVGRRVKAVDNGAILYGTITASVYSSPVTQVTVALDSGTFDANLTSVALGIDFAGKALTALAMSFPANSVPSSALSSKISTQAANYQILPTDNGSIILGDATTAARTFTLPNPALAGNGFKITIEKSDTSTNGITIVAFAAETISENGAPILNGIGQSITLTTDGTNWFKLAVKKAKTYQLFTASGMYTTPAGCVGVFRKVQAPGGGGGGYGSGANGTSGGSSSFGDITANGGGGGIAGNGGAPGAGGAGGSGGTTSQPGGQGSSVTATSGPGGGTRSGPGAGGSPVTVAGQAGYNAPQYSGGGGAAGASRTTTTTGAGPGAGGEYRDGPIAGLPAATYAVTIGAAGVGGTGTVSPGGNGDVGYIMLEESY